MRSTKDEDSHEKSEGEGEKRDEDGEGDDRLGPSTLGGGYLQDDKVRS